MKSSSEQEMTPKEIEQLEWERENMRRQARQELKTKSKNELIRMLLEQCEAVLKLHHINQLLIERLKDFGGIENDESVPNSSSPADSPAPAGEDSSN